MSALHIPCDGGPWPAKCIEVETNGEGCVSLDLTNVTEDNYRHVSLTPDEARAVATALLHYAKEVERVWK